MWTSNEPPITFEELAGRAAPVLIFSSLEFLRIRGLPIPGAIGDTNPEPDAKRVAYFRVREVRVERTNSWTDADKAAVRNIGTRWGCSDNARRVDELQHVIVRYFFYYPKDAGIGGHTHDLEALEVQIHSRPFCVPGASPARCFYGLTVASVAGSAHGTGWYTNVLQVDDTDDTILPLSALVERDKHATSPDRDGNGKYMPHYDTNRYTKDAWGVRDVVASGWLGGASFRAEFADDRGDGDRVFPARAFSEHISGYEARGRTWGGPTYELKHSESDRICPHGKGTNDEEKHLFSLMDGKNFCGDGGTRISRPLAVIAASQVAWNSVSPGPRSRYGFMSFSQRLSFAARIDGDVGLAAIVPIGLEVRPFGGWLVPRTTIVPFIDGNPFTNKPEAVRSFAAEALYAPSGSRVNDWYFVAGFERWRRDPDDALHWGPAAEIGVKYRFNVEKLRNYLLFKFVGFRAGLRTSSYSIEPDADGVKATIRHTRLVFEIGAGAW